MAVRAQGSWLPLGRACLAGARRRRDRLLGLRGGPRHVPHAHGATGNARPVGLSRSAGGDRVRARTRRRRPLRRTRARGATRALRAARYGPIAPESMVLRMASFTVPDAEAMQKRLWDEYRIEIPAMRDDLMRISVAIYTEREDVERLLDALAVLLSLSRNPA